MTTVGHSRCEMLDVIPARIVVEERLDETVACPKDDTIVSAPDAERDRRARQARRHADRRGGLRQVHRAPAHRATVHSLRPRRRRHRAADARSKRVRRHRLARARRPMHRRADAGPGPARHRRHGDPRPRSRRRPRASAPARSGAGPTRAGSPSSTRGAADSDSVRRFLGDDLARTVQCDGTNVTTFLERAGGERPGCWSHGRRGLVEAALQGDTLALEGVRIIAGCSPSSANRGSRATTPSSAVLDVTKRPGPSSTSCARGSTTSARSFRPRRRSDEASATCTASGIG